MEVQVKRSSLLRELIPMQGIVERRTTIPVLSHILLRAENDRLYLASTDLDVSLTSSCEAELSGSGSIAVQARKFLEIIRAVNAEDVSLKLEDEKRLRIAAGNSQFKINGLAAEDFPTLPEVPMTEKLTIPFGLLKKAVGRIIFAVSTEESRFQLNGALLKLNDGGLELVATDGHRLALVENDLAGSKAADGVLVPRKALQELLRFEEEGDLSFCRSDHHLSFRLGSRELICRILEGTFPDYNRVISKENDRQAEFEKKALSQAVQRVALLTGDRARAVRLELDKGRLVIKAANPDLGEAEEELECKYEGEELQIGMNPDYLIHFLSALDTDNVRLDLKDENTQCIGYPVNGEDKRFLCVIMPMRI
jgi:DNA polymerase-3 subunit beta